MSREDIVAIASRLFSVYLVVITVRFAFGLTTRIAFTEPDAVSLTTAALITITTLAIAAYMWLFPLTIARKLLPAMRDSGPTLSTSARQLQEIAFSILGMWVLSTALADASYWLSFGVFAGGLGTPSMELDADTKASLFATAFELLLGACLLFGSRGLTGLLYRVRYGNAPGAAP